MGCMNLLIQQKNWDGVGNGNGIFTDVVQAACQGLFHVKWKTITELVSVQVDEIDECLAHVAGYNRIRNY